MSDIKPKKMVRSVAIALGIICIILILIAGLGAIIEYYTMAINDKNNTIASLTESVNLVKSVVLANSQIITQTAGNYTSWKFIVNVTGYVYVSILDNPQIKNWYVRVIYNASIPPFFYPYQYDTQVNLDNMNKIIFPVLLSVTSSGPPSPHALVGTSVEVRVGNTYTVGN